MQHAIPHFIGIGAAKSGTTWLAEVLRTHPGLFVPPEKELTYFSSEKNFARDPGWYLNFFKGAAPGQITGEFSVNYMQEGPKAARRIFDFNKKAKLIVLVRDPVERAYSHYRWFQQLSQQTAFFTEELSKRSPVATNSLYYENLWSYYELFPPRQFLILQYAEIASNPRLVERSVYEFLGVDPSFQSKLAGKVIGQTINPRFRPLENLRIRLYKLARRHEKARWISFAKKSGLSTLYRKLNHLKPQKETLAPNELEAAYRFFREDMHQFSRLTGVDISRWTRKYEKESCPASAVA